MTKASRSPSHQKPTAPQWFSVDRSGLAKLVARRGKCFILSELLQNAWDEEGVRQVDMTLTREPGSRQATLVVEDDAPDGFLDLSHAYTLFAESSKKGVATQRGRFNLGEKLILALATEATIISTTGGWRFGPQGRSRLRQRRPSGSRVEITLPMTLEEIAECDAFIRRLLPPAAITTTYNGVALSPRPVAYAGIATLPTELADGEGNIRPTARQTEIRLIRPEPGEIGWLYEMGLPVVETGDTYHVDIGQKVPLDMERSNVTPAFLRKVRTEALNLAHELITHEEANSSWAREAMRDPNVSVEAVRSAIAARFSARAVAFDPSDPEANRRAVSEDYQVIHGSQLSAEEWSNVRRAGAAPPAGQVTPTPDVYGNGPLARRVPEADWTPAMRALAAFTRAVAGVCIGTSDIGVHYELEPGMPAANYGGRRLVFNLGRLGRRWPEQGITEPVVDLVIHELGHEFSLDHLSVKYHDGLTRIGARLALAVTRNGSLLRWEGYLRAAGQVREVAG